MYATFRRAAKQVAGKLAQRRRIDRYFTSERLPPLNIGSGYNTLEGWLNVDIEGGLRGAIYMDAADRFPFDDGSFDAILCEHMIEHVPKPLARNIISESYRILKPGGALRIITPDLATMAFIIGNPDDPQVVEFC